MTRIAGVLLAAALWAGCAGDAGDAEEAAAGAGGMPQMAGAIDTAGLRSLGVPAELQLGLERFDRYCASCHGEAALGTSTGPPLVHIYYEPNHHADAAFVLAAERGVRAHHWGFGDMPAQPGVQRSEVLEIVAYVRWLQREAGVY